MVTFGFDNRNNYDEAKELFEMEIANCGEEVLRAFFDDDRQIIQVIEGTEWIINIDLFRPTLSYRVGPARDPSALRFVGMTRDRLGKLLYYLQTL